MLPPTLAWDGDLPGRARVLDQTALPGEIRILTIDSAEGMAEAIARLSVRGAPAIGVAAAMGVVLGAQRAIDATAADALAAVDRAAALLARARPTAVALFRALDRLRAGAAEAARAGGLEVVRALLDEMRRMLDEDREICRRIGEAGASLLHDGDAVLTHCNAGALATTGIGTALAPIYRAVEEGRRVRVYATETRPLLQGARLTALELASAGIEVTLLPDGAAGRLLSLRRVAAVFVGADRIARNGDTANKVGTYPLALAAREHGVPFWVAAPLATFDLSIPDGAGLPIEERSADEVLSFAGRRAAAEGVKVFNPAFDVTPARCVTGFVTEAGRAPAPDVAAITERLRRSGRARE